jgi:osmotically-inducible protein OsmY
MQDKAAVLRQVQAAIGRQAHLDMQTRPVIMDFTDGRLTLEGEVADIGVKKAALRAAAEVEGVKDVVDRLRVDAGPSPGDGAIRDAVCRGLLEHIDFQNCALHALVKGQRETLRVAGGADPSGDIEVGVGDGIVTLRGQVISLSHKRLAGVLAWWVGGCRDVVNELKVVPAEEDSDDEIADALRLVLEVDPYVAAHGIGIDSRDHTVTLDGTVASAGERERAERDAWCVFAVDRVVNRIEVR